MIIRTLDITENRQPLADFIREPGEIIQPIDLMREGQLVARLVPPTELSEAEKAEIVRKGWEFVEKARANTRGVPEREIAKLVNAAVKRVRSQR
ncbi:MAG TPA: hypothetical protein VGP68_12555 [Gemmataceae bacterium]|jgi:hypothetical protein|nr:hypothetical protein [Gemmataceae bacterium]